MRRRLPGFPFRPRNLLHAAGLSILLAALTSPVLLSGQKPTSAQASSRLNVFLDCEGRECMVATTFFRTEIDWVNWVRNREDADVHVIMTRQTTGSGGNEYQLDFIGREVLDESDDQLFFRSLGTDVEQEELDGVTTTLAIGLARYAALSGLRGFVTFEPVAPGSEDRDSRVLGPQDVDDPWNLWVFEVSASGTLDWTEKRDSERMSGDFMASRTTPGWKLDLHLGANRNVVETLLSDSSVFQSTLTDWAAGGQFVYTLADHWSVGLISSLARLPRDNQRLRVQVTPGVEYSVFPYVEATRRTLTTRYTIGPTYRDYLTETIFDETEETRYQESLQVRYAHRQPWGDGSLSITASHFLDDIEQHNVALRGNVSFRIVRGLSLNLGGNISRVTDQIYLSAQGETDEEILLNLRSRASDKNWGFNVGFSYRFGSIYNNVVNNRFPSIMGG